MLRPAPMSRALIVGPRDELEDAIDALYDLQLLHIVDHREGEQGIGIGRPLGQASEASEVLVKLRSIASVLQIEEHAKVPEQEVGEDLRQKILSLELNISEEDAAKKKIQGLLADLTKRIDEIRPFAELPLALADYRGYESLEVLVGKTSREIEDLDSVTKEHEAFAAPGFLAVFVAKGNAAAMRDFLAHHGFTAVPIPEGDGDPKVLLEGLTGDKERWRARLAEIENRLAKLRERYADFLVAAKVHLEVQVEKAEAPLRFAVTDHSFVIEGWVPGETFPKLTEALARFPSVYVSELETDAHAADPPVLMRNAKPFRPFEFLVKLFSTPNYHEIDPTFIVAIGFPIFFGIMIGDAGYGLAWILFGLYLLRGWAKDPGTKRDLVVSVTVGGVFSLLFGLFVFAEAFGVPFHALKGAVGAGAVDWSAILGFDIPIRASIEKLHQVPDFIVLAIAASYLHLMAAFVIGFFNDIHRSKKHALGKVSWLLILTGVFAILMARTARWPEVEGLTTMGYAIWHGPLGWFPKEGIEYASLGFTASNPIPSLAVYLTVGGIGLLLLTEGALHVMEIFGLIANMISYARLAAVGVAKAAMAFAFNVIVYESFLLPWQEGGGFHLLIVGLVVAWLSHTLIFLLGAVSAYIQALRLNYVEFFIKFYKGAGTSFRPFGVRAKPEV